MKLLLALSRLIDALNECVGRALCWLVLATALISAGNAASRYLFRLSSNAFLEVQWYLFSGIFLLLAGYTLKHNAHVRIDLVSSHFSPRTRAWIDVFGGLCMLLPVCLIILWHSWDMFLNSFQVNETSPDAGGLLRWPIKLVIPLGFLLLVAQACSETIKRIAFLSGVADEAGRVSDEKT